MLRGAARWAAKTLVIQSAYHPDAFLFGFLCCMLMLCCWFGPNGLLHNAMGTVPSWLVFGGTLTAGNYISRQKRLRDRVHREAEIRNSKETGSIHGGGPALD